MQRVYRVSILGGDVYTYSQDTSQINYSVDSWHTERQPGESEADYVNRSIDTTINYIEKLKYPDGLAPLFAFVVNNNDSIQENFYDRTWKERLSMMLLCTKDMYDEAFAYMEEIVSSNPTDVDAFINLHFVLDELLENLHHQESERIDDYIKKQSAYYKQASVLLGNDPVYLFYTGVLICRSAANYGTSSATGILMMCRALELHPEQEIYKWATVFENHDNPNSQKNISNYYYSILLNEDNLRELYRHGPIGSFFGKYVREQMGITPLALREQLLADAP